VTIATPTGTTYSDIGLSATTTYRYWYAPPTPQAI
jgi:hypothetical protein